MPANILFSWHLTRLIRILYCLTDAKFQVPTMLERNKYCSKNEEDSFHEARVILFGQCAIDKGQDHRSENSHQCSHLRFQKGQAWSDVKIKCKFATSMMWYRTSSLKSAETLHAKRRSSKVSGCWSLCKISSRDRGNRLLAWKLARWHQRYRTKLGALWMTSPSNSWRMQKRTRATLQRRYSCQ